MSQVSPHQKLKNKKVPYKVSELKEAAVNLLKEAERCCKNDPEESKPVMGLAAMTTAFAVVLALGEILAREKKKEYYNETETPIVLNCIVNFFQGKTTHLWLVYQNEQQQNTPEVLCEVRNSLAHSLLLPKNVVLLIKKEDYNNSSEMYPAPIGIVPSLFVEAVRQRTEEIFNKWSTSSRINIYVPLKAERGPSIVSTINSSTSSQGGSGYT
jgi:hypothetical protein